LCEDCLSFAVVAAEFWSLQKMCGSQRTNRVRQTVDPGISGFYPASVPIGPWHQDTIAASYIVHLSEVARCGRFTLATHAFFMASEATGAQEDALSKPRRRLAQWPGPDLSLTTQKNVSLQPHRCFLPSVAAQRWRWWHCLLAAGTQPATLPKSHS